MPPALYQFSTIWNLLLDDYQFELQEVDGTFALRLAAQSEAVAQRFWHMMILKLAHGLQSWLARREVPVLAVDFAFACPSLKADHAAVFPAPVRFDAMASALHLELAHLGAAQLRSTQNLDRFLENAPRD